MYELNKKKKRRILLRKQQMFDNKTIEKIIIKQ